MRGKKNKFPSLKLPDQWIYFPANKFIDNRPRNASVATRYMYALLWLSSIVQLPGHWMPYVQPGSPVISEPFDDILNPVGRVSTGPWPLCSRSHGLKMRASGNLLSIKCIQQGNSGWYYQLDNERDGRAERDLSPSGITDARRFRQEAMILRSPPASHSIFIRYRRLAIEFWKDETRSSWKENLICSWKMTKIHIWPLRHWRLILSRKFSCLIIYFVGIRIFRCQLYDLITI